MKIRVCVDKVAALKAGKDRHGGVVVEVPAADLGERQREVLARYSGGQDCDFDVYYEHGPWNFCGDLAVRFRGQLPKLAEATQETVKSLLDAIGVAVADCQAFEAERAHGKREQLLAKVAEWRALPLEERVEVIMREVTESEFFRLWDSSASPEEAAEKLDCPLPRVLARAESYIKRGLPLKKMGPFRPGREFDE